MRNTTFLSILTLLYILLYSYREQSVSTSNQICLLLYYLVEHCLFLFYKNIMQLYVFFKVTYDCDCIIEIQGFHAEL